MSAATALQAQNITGGIIMSLDLSYLTNACVGLVLCLSVPAASACMGGLSNDSATDDPGFQEGKTAIETQNWAKAIEILGITAEAFPGSADTQNYLGYAYRKSGDLDAAFRHYQRALEIDPLHKNAHEYVGEAYLMKDDLAGAQQHLAELAKICTPIPCEEYRELKRAVDEFKKK
jgi:tetratricopeptide (TPR) repeat protein